MKLPLGRPATLAPYWLVAVVELTWKSPPILDDASDTMRMAGRKYKLFYDGNRLRLVSWSTPRAVYWVSNTLSKTLTNRQMLAIARSLSRFGGR